jgi:hypothetical protein
VVGGQWIFVDHKPPATNYYCANHQLLAAIHSPDYGWQGKMKTSMPFIQRSKQILWTRHARAKMMFYKLSKQRVVRVIHRPLRTEEGVAPKTVAMMQPTAVRSVVPREISHEGAKSIRGTCADRGRGARSLKFEPTRTASGRGVAPKETWSQEIWVMVQDVGKHRKIISAWRYPGMTRPRGDIAMDALRREYREFFARKS